MCDDLIFTEGRIDDWHFGCIYQSTAVERVRERERERETEREREKREMPHKSRTRFKEKTLQVHGMQPAEHTHS